MAKKSKNKNRWKERFFVAGLVVAVFFILASSLYAYSYQNKIYPSVYVGAFPLGGLTVEEAEQNLTSSLENLRDRGLLFSHEGLTISVPMVAVTTEDPDLSYEIINYDVPAILESAYNVGRGESFIDNWIERFTLLKRENRQTPAYNLRQDKVLEILRQNFAQLENPAKESALYFSGTTPLLTEETYGKAFDYRQALQSAHNQLSNLLFSSISLNLRDDRPKILKENAKDFLPLASELAFSDPVNIGYDDIEQNFYAEQINNLMEIRIKDNKTGELELGVSKAKLAELLSDLATQIKLSPQEPKFKIDGDRVIEFTGGQEGRQLVLEETWQNWEDVIIRNRLSDLALVVSTLSPKQKISDLNNLGIQELLGVGKSNFAGSPQNRRHNIKIGAESVNGTLIPPGGEFSLIKTLGEIDAQSGYLPELVIKGNKTIPEYGGGLCQIGTTAFRATLNSGLPITARRNHSYAVSYYNNEKGLPGTDATIYDPAPDYKFKNDTGHYVLIAARIEGNEAIFEFWGTRDGRAVEQSDIRVWDRVKPNPTKFIETLDLKPGETKCTESPHDGIKAAFDYKITYPDGQEKEETFFSQYRPWQEVCLIGVEKLSETPNTSVELESNEESVSVAE